MKKWEVPQVNVDKFVANEYVAACDFNPTTNTFTLTCDNDSLHSYGDAQHQDSNPHNDIAITLPDGALNGLSGKNTRFFSQNGASVYNATNLTDIPIGSDMNNAEYIWGFQYNPTAKRYFYHIYHLEWSLFGRSYQEYSGWHVALAGSANPLS